MSLLSAAVASAPCSLPPVLSVAAPCLGACLGLTVAQGGTHTRLAALQHGHLTGALLSAAEPRGRGHS